MKLNSKAKSNVTHEGGKAYTVNSEMQLRRSVMSCLLWEREFYESGEDIAQRIEQLVARVNANKVAAIAIEAREKMNLRHVPLMIVRHMAALETHKGLVAQTLAKVIQRPDELAEFVAMYWKDGKCPLSAQVKKGLAKAFTKFNAYELAKYNRDGAIKLRDVLFLCHAKPTTPQMAEDWKKLVANELPIPDTWEVALSSGTDKNETWTRLLRERKLGALALLRNLSNMRQANVDQGLVREALRHMRTARVLPYRFIAAARFAPDLEPELELAMFKNLEGVEKMQDKTCLLIDVSGSMDCPISGKSDLKRIDAACGLAMLLKEVCSDLTVRTFSDHLAIVAPRRGFALRDAIVASQPHRSTYLGKAVDACERELEYDRLIVISDEQSSDLVPNPVTAKPYMINVASAKNGVGYGLWTHVDGWSESVVNYIRHFESTVLE